MTALAYLFAASIFASLVASICLLTVIIQMFMHGESGIAIADLLLSSCLIVALLALFYGWSKADEWKNVPLMPTSSVLFSLSAVLQAVLQIAWCYVAFSQGAL